MGDFLSEFVGKKVVMIFEKSVGGANGEDSRSSDVFKGKFLAMDDKFVKLEEDYGTMGTRTCIVNRNYIMRVREFDANDGERT